MSLCFGTGWDTTFCFLDSGYDERPGQQRSKLLVPSDKIAGILSR